MAKVNKSYTTDNTFESYNENGILWLFAKTKNIMYGQSINMLPNQSITTIIKKNLLIVHFI